MCIRDSLHAAQIQGFFDIPVDNMLGNPLFTRYYMSKFDEKLFNHCLLYTSRCV